MYNKLMQESKDFRQRVGYFLSINRFIALISEIKSLKLKLPADRSIIASLLHDYGILIEN